MTRIFKFQLFPSPRRKAFSSLIHSRRALRQTFDKFAYETPIRDFQGIEIVDGKSKQNKKHENCFYYVFEALSAMLHVLLKHLNGVAMFHRL